MLFSTSSLFAQYEKEWLQNLSEEDQQQLEAIAMYPEQTRMDILEIAQYPQAIIKLKRIQTQTKESFLQLLEDYTAQEKKAIWDLTRYPKLIERLAGVTSIKERNTILNDYPKVIYNRGKFVAREFPDILVAIATLQQSIRNTINEVISVYPAQTATAIERLVDLPEVLTLLGDNLELTMLLGETYKNDTSWVTHQVDSIHLQLARNNVKELEDWKTNITNNPEASQEMEQAAKDFEETYGYDDDYYAGYPDDIYYNETDEYDYVVEHHYYYHYPFWFGYPSWYTYPRWRPFPWWLEWGFYIRPNFGIYITGLPSHFCINWYFDLGYHHYYFPHFSAHLVQHYYDYRHGQSGITHGVHRWKVQNQNIITDQWLTNKAGRVDRFKELGRFEKDRLAFNRKHVKNQLTKKEFLIHNQSRYSDLDIKRETVAPKKKTTTFPTRKTTPQVKPKTKTKKPKIKRPAKKNTTPKISKPPKVKPKPKPKPVGPKMGKSKKTKKPMIKKKKKANIPRIKRSKDFHTKSWESRKKKN